MTIRISEIQQNDIYEKDSQCNEIRHNSKFYEFYFA